MIFTAPWVLLALLALPVLWWLLRATPPAPRAQNFPAIRLLAALRPREETPARTPWWLLALRLAASALIIIGVAGPVAGGGGDALPGRGPVLLVVDNGWASGPDWPARQAAISSVLDRAERDGRKVALLATAAGLEPPHATAFMPASVLRPIASALMPSPWGDDRGAAAHAIGGLAAGPTVYLADGVAGQGRAGAFPAPAGMNRRSTTATRPRPCVPRTRGDEPS